MGAFTWADLIRHLTDWRRKDWRTDPERDTYRLQNLEWVVQAMLEKLRDDETAKQAQFTETPWGRKD